MLLHTRPRRALILTAAIALAVGGAPPLLSQDAAVQCHCGAQFQALLEAMRRNYAGFRDKTSAPADSIAHARMVDVLRDQARHTTGPACERILTTYARFFADGHLQVRFATSGTRAPLATLGDVSAGGDATSDPLLGTWESPSGRTRIRIVPAPPPFGSRDRIAVNVVTPDTAWPPRSIRGTLVADPEQSIYHATWFSPRQPPQQWAAVVVDDSVLLTGFDGWYRVDSSADARTHADPLRPALREAAPGIGVLSLPSMQVQYARAVDSIVRARGDMLNALRLLVIDIRGNQGGGDGTYMPLLPLIATDTLTGTAGSVLSAPAIIAYYERFLDPAGVNSPQWVVDMLREMRARPGEQIALPAARLGFPVPRRGPEQVAILMDGVVASSAETFLLWARQSPKVRLFGRATAGIVDYLNPAHHDLGCGVTLQAPTIRRSVLLPSDALDNRGIVPHVVLDADSSQALRLILQHYGR